MKTCAMFMLTVFVAFLPGCGEDLPVSGEDPSRIGTLATPEPVLPLPEQPCSAIGVNMQWTSVGQAATYVLEIGDGHDGTFAAEYSAVLSGASTMLVLPPAFCGRRLGWRVRAAGTDSSASPWSSLSWFRLLAFEEDFASRPLRLLVSGLESTWLVENRLKKPYERTIGPAPESFVLHHDATFADPVVNGSEWRYSTTVTYVYPPEYKDWHTDTLRLTLAFSADRTLISRALLSVRSRHDRSTGPGLYDESRYRRDLDLEGRDISLRPGSFSWDAGGSGIGSHIAAVIDSASFIRTTSVHKPISEGGGWVSSLQSYRFVQLQSVTVSPSASFRLFF